MPIRYRAFLLAAITAALGTACVSHHPRNITYGGRARGGGPRALAGTRPPVLERSESIST
jgi:hypothetical protein